MLSMRPSMRGWFSITAMSDIPSTILLSIFHPSSVWAISRPLNRTVTLALLPSSRNRRTCLALKSKSWVSVLGPSLTSFTWMIVCFLRASFCRRACMYLNLPKSMIRQTGGCASAATSTRSMSRWRARSSACWIGRIPSCSPSALTTRTSRTRMPSLIRMSFDWMARAPVSGAGSAGVAHGEGGGTTSDLGGELGHDALHRHRAHVFARAPAHAGRAALGLALSHHQHVRHLSDLGVADAIAQLLVAVVELGADPRRPERGEHLATVLAVLLADRQHARLDRREPGRERAREVLGQDRHEPLVGAEDRAVDHHRALGLAVGVDVLALHPLGQHREIDLDGGELPLAAQRVLHVDVDLGPVERAATLVVLVEHLVGPQRLVERLLRLIPLLLGPELVGRTGRDSVGGLQAEGAVPLAHQLQQIGDLGLHLLGAAVQVRVVLGELPHPHEARERAGALVAVVAPHLRVADGQIAVGAERPLVDEGGLRAVHRLEAEDLVLDLELEHVVLVELPVPGLLPELLVHQQRGRDLLVAPRVERLARVLLQLAHEDHAPGQPERRPGRDVEEVEQVELAPELAVVALLRLLEPPEVLVELLLGEPRGPVDPLQHRVLLVPAPVGAGGRQELEGLDLARRRHVGPAAEIEEIALAVDRHPGRVESAQDLHLERLAALLEEPDRPLTVHLLAHERIVRLDDLAHDVLDAREILRREGLGLQEVV